MNLDKRLSTAMAVLSLAALALTGCSGSAATAPSATSSPAATAAPADLKTASTALGSIVVDGKGMAVYIFDKDVKDPGKSACAGPCVGIWPALTTTTATPVVDGVAGTVGVITTDTGAKQVTLNGMPLYRYSKDSAPGDVAGQGFNNIWWVLSPAGAKIGTPAP
ncbi:COG4315 family predicted lipoprotein [Arthrobacter sp. 35W]|uniref:COG4315 family predicted lipoprotein n=1 Tax=Arthrobacter sp. 35W TaxID=1132441 RepID=UPI0004041716|nr:hypothetical protein [Arthrobacter sp. 35W]